MCIVHVCGLYVCVCVWPEGFDVRHGHLLCHDVIATDQRGAIAGNSAGT